MSQFGITVKYSLKNTLLLSHSCPYYFQLFRCKKFVSGLGLVAHVDEDSIFNGPN